MKSILVAHLSELKKQADEQLSVLADCFPHFPGRDSIVSGWDIFGAQDKIKRGTRMRPESQSEFP
jgi:hypothetical protein